jgi:glucokinase
MSSAARFLGVDLGGTQMRMAAVAADGRLATEVRSAQTGRDFGPGDLRRQLRELATQVRGEMGDGTVAALGFGTAGVVGHGPLSQCDNLPLLNGVDVGALVESTMAGCLVRVENDARCFTLAEARYGAGRGARDVVGITLGTGVGCGVMIGGQLHRGTASQAGEVWRIPVREGHLEHFLSGRGILRGYLARGGAPEATLAAAQVEERARAGDEAALRAWRDFGADLAFLCEAVIALLDPAVVVIGGSLSRAGDLYRPVLDARLGERAARVVAAELGPAAGVIGAAALHIDSPA